VCPKRRKWDCKIEKKSREYGAYQKGGGLMLDPPKGVIGQKGAKGEVPFDTGVGRR